MMYVIMLPCYLIFIGVLWYTMKTVSKPDGYFLLGVKLPKEHMQDQVVQGVVANYKKSMKRLIVVAIVTTLIPILFYSLPMTQTLYMMVWIFGLLGYMQWLLNKAFDGIYNYKVQQGWLVGKPFVLTIDTELIRLKNQVIYPKWHLIIIGILTIMGSLLWLPRESGYTAAYWIAGCNVLVYLSVIFLYVIMLRSSGHVYSAQEEINVAYNQSYRYEMTKAIVWLGYSNAFAWLVGGFFPRPYENSILILIVVISTSVIACALLVVGYEKARRIRAALGQLEEGENTVDDDCYWRGGIYNNPYDPKLWVGKRIGIGTTMNMAHKGAKIMNGSVFIILLGTFAMLFYYLPMDFPKLNLTLTDQALVIDARTYSTTLSLEAIERVEVLEELPNLYKNSGYNSGDYLFGKFQARGYGACQVYLNKKVAPFILIHSQDTLYLINSSVQEEMAILIDYFEKRALLE